MIKVRIKDKEWFLEQHKDIEHWRKVCHDSFGKEYSVASPDELGFIDVNDVLWNPTEYDIIEEEATKESEEKTEYSDKHYNFSYKLSEEEIEKGEIRLDPYKICKEWGLNEKDNTGGLFHILKTVCRFGDKNPKERELKAIKATATRMEELLK